MRAIVVTVATALAALSAGCLKKSAFNCADDMACGAGGTCEVDTGFCSVENGDCASGRSYSDTAGNGLAGQCVGGGTPTDGPIDGPIPDTPVPIGCNADFVAITDGNPNHKYKAFTAQAIWVTQQNTLCSLQNTSYMAIPDNALELAAIFALANAKIWLGVSDLQTETQFRDTKTQPYTALALSGNNGNKDCATTNDGVAPLAIEDCDNQSLPVVCECEE